MKASSHGLTVFHIASYNGHMEALTNILKNGININIQTNLGKTVLHLAIQNGHPEVVKELTANGA